MQKLVGIFDKTINDYLEDGWRILKEYHEMALIEKCEQMIVKISGEEKIKPYLNDGWKIKQMSSAADSEDICCFVLLEK